MRLIITLGKAAVRFQPRLYLLKLLGADESRNLRHENPFCRGDRHTAEGRIFARRGRRASLQAAQSGGYDTPEGRWNRCSRYPFSSPASKTGMPSRVEKPAAARQ